MYPDQLHQHGSTLLDPATPVSGRHVAQESTVPRCLSRAEVAARAAGASTENERRHWLVIALQVDGRSTAEIVAATGCRPRTIRQIAQRYRESGPAALVDRRARSQGAPPLLQPAMQDELREMLQSPPPGGGVWTGPMVAQWIAAKTGRRVHRQRGWEYLRRLEGTAKPHDARLQASPARTDEES